MWGKWQENAEGIAEDEEMVVRERCPDCGIRCMRGEGGVRFSRRMRGLIAVGAERVGSPGVRGRQRAGLRVYRAGCQLGKKRAEGGRGGWGITEFVAKATIEASPFVILGVVWCRNTGLVEALLKFCRCWCGKIVHGNAPRQKGARVGRCL